jgi:phosphoglycerate dehydrogenase-like enzyme
MRALVTASFDPAARARLERLMPVVHEDWRERHHIYFHGEELGRRIADVGADVLIVEADMVGADVLGSGVLRMVGCARGEPVNVDVAAATRHGIPVFHAPGRNADAVADLTLAFMLVWSRHLQEIAAYYRGDAQRIEGAGDFLALYNRFTGRELGGLTVGLIGLGAVGREVAARLAAFKAPVLGYDPYLETPPPGVTVCGLDALLRQSDIVSLHAPVTPETERMLSRERLATMKPEALLVNTARAALTDEDALYEALRAGRLGGAALDVLAVEPLQPGNRFLALPNVIATPHIGGATGDVVRHHSEQILDSIERHLRGERARWIANPAVYESR